MKKYLLNVLIGIDQLVNAALGGDPDLTISDRIGRVKVLHGGKIPKRYFLMRTIAWGLNKIDPNHCIDSIEHDETAKDEVWKWG
jgi:hypothetical protein